MTLTDASPAEPICAAADSGFDMVSLWASPRVAYPRQLLTPAVARDCAALCARTGVAVYCLEAFELASVATMRDNRVALELGARMGGQAVLAYHGATADRAEAIDALATLVEIAGELGLGVNLEPVAMGGTRTLAEAEALIQKAGVDVGILFDTYHLVRSGGHAADVTAALGRIRYVQVNDGPAHVPPAGMLAEAASDRLLPGDGAFPLGALLRAAPRDVPWGIEAPRLRAAAAGMSVTDQARTAMAALRRLLADLDADAA